MEFLKTILIILLVIFGVRIIFRFAAPYVMRYVARKAGERFANMAHDFKNTNTQRPAEGQTTIIKGPANEHTSNKKVGEYIDYEEID
ncbi:MAG: DUF4834 family protein [Leeuwenhoekiella sp.]